jgi:carboxymethylenebutenolidase
MSQEQVTIRTRDGECRAYVCTPEGTGPWPAVIFYMDGLGIRPTLIQMSQRLADQGYVVLLPDLFYRVGPYEPFVVADVYATGDPLGVLAKYLDSTDNQTAAQDSDAFLNHLSSRDDVSGDGVGTTGYCMGGAISLTVAGMFPDRVAAAASFHGGRLVTDSPLSPHLLADKIRARVYVAGADSDRSYTPEDAQELDAALTAAGVEHRCEIYPEALHGFTMRDFPVYNEPAAERHWEELSGLLGAQLR